MADASERCDQSGWERFFGAMVDVLDESEAMWESPDPDCREAVQIRLEYAIEGIQSILPFFSETRMVMEEILRNLHQIYRQWMARLETTTAQRILEFSGSTRAMLALIRSRCTLKPNDRR